MANMLWRICMSLNNFLTYEVISMGKGMWVMQRDSFFATRCFSPRLITMTQLSRTYTNLCHVLVIHSFQEYYQNKYKNGNSNERGAPAEGMEADSPQGEALFEAWQTKAPEKLFVLLSWKSVSTGDYEQTARPGLRRAWIVRRGRKHEKSMDAWSGKYSAKKPGAAQKQNLLKFPFISLALHP